jgi:hypothetical protein
MEIVNNMNNVKKTTFIDWLFMTKLGQWLICILMAIFTLIMGYFFLRFIGAEMPPLGWVIMIPVNILISVLVARPGG